MIQEISWRKCQYEFLTRESIDFKGAMYCSRSTWINKKYSDLKELLDRVDLGISGDF